MKSLIESYVRNSMLVLNKAPISDEPDAEDPMHREHRRILRLVNNVKAYKDAINELNNYSPKNATAFKMKLSLPRGVKMVCDLDGIHFVNGRLDLHMFQFSEREHLLKSFGSREKLDYCLSYAGAALRGRSAVTSCSAMFMSALEDPERPRSLSGSRLLSPLMSTYEPVT
ncbi:hypothetical protein EON65_39865 [archaeon]|nr:MAG: hypothetical protein EON65_39865 [archaeon]